MDCMQLVARVIITFLPFSFSQLCNSQEKQNLKGILVRKKPLYEDCCKISGEHFQCNRNPVYCTC